MRNILVVIVAALLGLPALAWASGSGIGVVDVTVIFAQAKAAKSIERQRETVREAFLAEITKSENTLRAEEQALAKDIKEAKDISQEDYAKRRLAYEEKMIATRKMAQEKKRQLEEASNKAMDQLREALYGVVQEIANERGYSLVISNRDVIAGEKSLDITEEALKRLDERVSDIPLQITQDKDTP